MENTTEPQYFGTKMVVEVSEMDGMVQYTLDNGQSGIVTKEQFDNIVKRSNEYQAAGKADDDMVRIFKFEPAISQILEILLKNKMKVIERAFVLGRIDESIINNYDKAIAKLLERDFEHNVDLEDIDKVLKS